LIFSLANGASVRITLDIDDDVLAAAREIAGLQRRRLGKVISDLARQGLAQSLSAIPSKESAKI
jgi:Arc/MetJ family transcription regulator